MVYDVTHDQLSTVEFRDSQSGAVYCAAFARALGKLVVVAAAGVRDNGHLPFFSNFWLRDSRRCLGIEHGLFLEGDLSLIG